MELRVTPEDLHAAAVALAGCAARLDDEVAAFAAAVARDVPDLGREAVAAAGESATRAEHAVETIADDITQLGRALRLLAHLYAQVDHQAVHR